MSSLLPSINGFSYLPFSALRTPDRISDGWWYKFKPLRTISSQELCDLGSGVTFVTLGHIKKGIKRNEGEEEGQVKNH